MMDARPRGREAAAQAQPRALGPDFRETLAFPALRLLALQWEGWARCPEGHARHGFPASLHPRVCQISTGREGGTWR